MRECPLLARNPKSLLERVLGPLKVRSLVLSVPYFLSILIQNGIKKITVDPILGGGVPLVPPSGSATARFTFVFCMFFVTVSAIATN